MMKARRSLAIAVLASIAGVLIISTALGQRLAATNSAGIFDYEVTNDDGVLFADEFERLGGVDTLGYPASHRFRRGNQWDGFTYQLTQGALLQWRPVFGKAYLANTFEILEARRRDDWLLHTKGIPLPIKDDGSGGDWNKAREIRLSWLTNEQVKAKYLANPNPEKIETWNENRSIELYGLPMSYPERHGPFISQRFQRVAFQLWVEEVQGMPAPGTVVRVLGGDLLKEAGLVPLRALAPGDRPKTAAFERLLSATATPARRPAASNATPTVPHWHTPTPLPAAGRLLSSRVVTLDSNIPRHTFQIGSYSLSSDASGWVINLNDFPDFRPGLRVTVAVVREECARPAGQPQPPVGCTVRIWLYQSLIGRIPSEQPPGSPVLHDPYYLTGHPSTLGLRVEDGEWVGGNLRRIGSPVGEGLRIEEEGDYFLYVFAMVPGPGVFRGEPGPWLYGEMGVKIDFHES